MAKYIMSILKNKMIIVWSWGFNNPQAVQNGLQFRVQGFKFRGIVQVIYNEGHDLFDVSFKRGNKVVKSIDGVFFDMIVDVIDDYVERTADYERRVKENYSI